MNWLSSLRSNLFGTRRHRRIVKRPAPGKRRSPQLAVKPLEDRLTPSANMVGDLNAYTNGSNPSNITSAAGTTFFTATTNSGNVELFKTDGTAAGTVELTSGNQLTSFGSLTSFNGKLVFDSYDSAKGFYELWTSDGTVAGTTPFVAGGTIVELIDWSSEPMTVAGTKLYFQAYDPSNNLWDLWVSNGTSTGTHPVQPGNSTTATNISNLTNVNGELFFESYDNSTGNNTLWKSDGTASGTSMVAELTANQANDFTAVGSELYFKMYDSANSVYALWKSNGTASGTSMVADVGGSGGFGALIGFNSKLFFTAYDPTDAPDTNYALWTSNGTTTVPFTFGSSHTPVQLDFEEGELQSQAIVSGYLYFEGYNSAHSYSLWKTDGVSTSSNTGVVQSDTASPFVFDRELMTVVGTELYFIASTSTDGGNYDLWKSNGTNAGTMLVQTSGFGRNINDLTASGSKVFFSAYDVDANGNSPHGQELWVSDGTGAGTGMVTDINTVTYDSNPSSPTYSAAGPLVTVGNEVFFNALTYAPVNGTDLWQSDGTAANTAPVQTSTGVVPTGEGNVTPVGNTVFFTAYDSSGYDLWTTGTSTKSAAGIFDGSSSNPFGGGFASWQGAFVSFNGELYFNAYDAANSQWALWKSDGTAAGTTLIADIDPGAGPGLLTPVGSNLFWENYDSANGTWALWEYNSSTGTASMVQDINTNQSITSLTAVGSNVFFQALDSTTGNYALWVSNGTTTTNLAEFPNQLFNCTAFNNLLWFDTYNSNLGGYQMYTSDGTAANTVPFLSGNGLPVFVSPNVDNNQSTPFTIVGSKLYYANFNDQLAVTDGTAAGTGDVQAGAPLGTTIAQSVNYLTNDNGALVFTAYDPAHGTELWQSDGTATGTVLADDILPGPGSSNPTNLSVAGNQLFFAANDGIHGNELWTATLSQTVVTSGLSGPSYTGPTGAINGGVTEQHLPFVLTANDSNSSNNAAGFSFNINWGDGTSETVAGQSGLTADHQYAAIGNFTVSVSATNLTDGVTSASVSQVESISQTAIENGNLALGGVAGNSAWGITKGTSGTGYFTATVNGSTKVITNYKPATGMQVFLYSGNGTNSVSFNDAAVTTADTFTIGSGFVIYNKATFVSQSPLSGWVINGSNAADTYTISGTLTASITAGSKNDVFKMTTGANLLGTINGGGGVNTLDYTGLTTSGVIVDLPLDSATAIDGGANNGIANIENVNGSGHGGDILVGNGQANVLASKKGHNVLIGGSGGGDTLTSGGTGDILIAGSTNYDTNLAALQFILGEWAVVTPSTYAAVSNSIQTSATDPLNASAVTDSGSPDLADILNGKSGKTAVEDWYFAHTAGGTNPNDTINNLFSGEMVTSI